MMYKEILNRLRQGDETRAYYTNAEGEQVEIYSSVYGTHPPAFVRHAEVYGIHVTDNGVLECEVEEP